MICAFGCPEAHYLVRLERGCVCFPDARALALCVQHWHRLEPLGWAEVVGSP